MMVQLEPGAPITDPEDFEGVVCGYQLENDLASASNVGVEKDYQSHDDAVR